MGKWSEECAQAFKVAKEVLVSAQALAHYDPPLPLLLAAVASSYGVGVVVSHQYPDGTECQIAFASRTLTTAEKNYTQLEKEALALVFGVKHFHQYLYGRVFTIVTDHQPLTYRWVLKSQFLHWPQLVCSGGPYYYQHTSAESSSVKTIKHANADGPSRLLLQTAPGPEVSTEAACFNIGQI